MKVFSISRTVSAIALLSAMSAGSAQAAVITYEFTNTTPSLISGNLLSAPPAGIFATARFHDLSAGTVGLTLSVAGGLASNLYVSQWLFNIAGSANLTSATGNGTTMGAASTLPATSSTNFAGAGQTFDFRLDFTTERPRELDAGSSVSYTLTGTNGFNANSFLTGNSSNVFAAVRVGGGSTDSFFKTLNTNGVATPGAVPEPVTLSILGLGLAGIALSRRRKPLAK